MTFYLNTDKFSHKLKLGINILGRLHSVDLQIKDPYISRKHLSLDLLSDNSLTVMDLGSSNGLFVKGKKVPHAILYDGDSFIVGQTLLKVSRKPLIY